ncbi:uncharacterized protein YndB with AHSA1/START domain [Nocardia transvalensis]|uniref:Uncharacterized protein YndB with AHSA1/START domain n=1 Tax=Nocardia transvalensis TaxID=37333 RepID=A0A7W9P8N2_9NOCA|nr:SRPBCC domain-containing protein [Nocardia transvalensis]MBB5911174.1 uncharacterized protein YndB with AHSA1/START domain [Nocardia transvalensis]
MRTLTHPPEKVWCVLTQTRHVGRWYPLPVVDLDPVPGGAVRFDDGQGALRDGVVTAAEQPRRFEFTDADVVLRFDLRPQDHGCVLVVTLRLTAPYPAPGTCRHWWKRLDTLETLLADEAPVAAGS